MSARVSSEGGALFFSEQAEQGELSGRSVSVKPETERQRMLRLILVERSTEKTKPIVEAAKMGHLSRIEGLLPEGEKVSELATYAALAAAAEGKDDVVRFFCQKYEQDRPLLVGVCLVAAAGNGQLDVINMLLDGDWEIPRDCQEIAVEIALEGKRPDIMCSLLSKGPKLLGEFREHISARAAKRGYTDVVKLLSVDPVVQDSEEFEIV